MKFYRKINAVRCVSDDLDIAPDFYEYFLKTDPILKSDPLLWCVSAWNDNGKEILVNANQPGNFAGSSSHPERHFRR